VSTPAHLLVVVCGAGPADDVDAVVALAQARSWTVQVVATRSALSFVDIASLGRATGFPVHSRFQQQGETCARRLPNVDAVIVATATYNR
jgi:Flavoprotein